LSFFVSESIKDKLDEETYNHDGPNLDDFEDSIRALFVEGDNRVFFKIQAMTFKEKMPKHFNMCVSLHSADIGKLFKQVSRCEAVYLSDHEIKIKSSNLLTVKATDKINEYLVDINCVAE
tara:strand:- start:216 stop:575 length:360 start_codon:yes stop_codon:yes gene_type:complete